jgi:hypothetical protein
MSAINVMLWTRDPECLNELNPAVPAVPYIHREVPGKQDPAGETDHANAIRVGAVVAEFTAGAVRVLSALGRARRCADRARANHADAGSLDTGIRRGPRQKSDGSCATSDIGGKR